jgi:hypothetical protein
MHDQHSKQLLCVKTSPSPSYLLATVIHPERRKEEEEKTTLPDAGHI